MDIGLLTKKVANIRAEKVNLVRTWGKFVRHDEFDSKDEEKYLDKEMTDLWAKGQGYNMDPWNTSKWIKVGTIIGIGTGKKLQSGMVTRGERMIIRRRVVCMFPRRTMMLTLGLKNCSLSMWRVQRDKPISIRKLRQVIWKLALQLSSLGNNLFRYWIFWISVN